MLGGARVPDIGGATVPCIVALQLADLGEAVDMREYGSLDGYQYPRGASPGGCPAYLAPEICNAT